MPGPLPLQLAPASAPLTAIVGTFLLALAFYAATAFLAARYVLGSAELLPSAGVGVVLATVSLLLGPFGPAVAIVVSLAADVVAINRFLGLDRRDTALVTLAHYVLSAVLGVALFNLVRLLDRLTPAHSGSVGASARQAPGRRGRPAPTRPGTPGRTRRHR
ncbi:MAG: hypothetical protein U5J98_02245 [Halobacteriales archaeon]|nr:hypothetical protein [Halobacteriales archaeon]